MDMLTILEVKTRIAPICRKYGVMRAYLFGSYARGEATVTSDIDIRIEAGAIRDLFTLSAFRLDLMEAFGCDVDVVTSVPEATPFWCELSRDEVLLYAA